nr:hypothetical protein [Tanacetum cinerariifolium]
MPTLELQWLEKMESLFHISGCAVDNQVKFATCTLLGATLTWWNGHVRTSGHDVAYAMTWGTLKKKLTDKYYPKGEIKKLEIELYNHKVDKYTNGLSGNIHGNVMSARPKTLDEAIELANNLMDQKLRTYAERQTESKRKFDNNNQAQQIPKSQNVAQAYAIRTGERKEYAGTFPLCNKCSFTTMAHALQTTRPGKNSLQLGLWSKSSGKNSLHLWFLVQELKKHQVVTAGTPKVAQGAPGVDEGDQAVSAPIQAPQKPAAGPARTMAQRLGRLEEGVHGLQGALGKQREVLDSMARDFSRFTTWTVTRVSRMMDQAGFRIPEIGFCMFFLYFAQDLAGKEIDEVGKVSIIWNPMCVVVMLESRHIYNTHSCS